MLKNIGELIFANQKPEIRENLKALRKALLNLCFQNFCIIENKNEKFIVKRIKSIVFACFSAGSAPNCVCSKLRYILVIQKYCNWRDYFRVIDQNSWNLNMKLMMQCDSWIISLILINFMFKTTFAQCTFLFKKRNIPSIQTYFVVRYNLSINSDKGWRYFLDRICIIGRNSNLKKIHSYTIFILLLSMIYWYKHIFASVL